MTKCVLFATAMWLCVGLVVAKDFEVLNYPNSGCTGTPVATEVPIDTCLPIPNNANYTAMKYGVPRDTPIVTIYPYASTNCTTYGEVLYLACGRCEPAADPAYGPFHRLLCNVKDQKVSAENQCSDKTCTSCKEKFDFTVGQCVLAANGTRSVIVTELKKALAMPQLLFDATNSTCDPKTAVRIFDAPCGKCLGNAVLNCTLTGSSVPKNPRARSLPRHLRPLNKH